MTPRVSIVTTVYDRAARLAPHTYAARLQTVLATVGLAVAA